MNPRHCIHYDVAAGGEPVCAIGIDIRARFTPRWPCWTGNDPAECSARCAEFRAPTPEQVAERERQSYRATARMLTALVAITEYERGAGEILNQPRTLVCPCCQAELKFLRAKHHLYAKCATPQCVEFRGNCRR